VPRRGEGACGASESIFEPFQREKIPGFLEIRKSPQIREVFTPTPTSLDSANGVQETTHHCGSQEENVRANIFQQFASGRGLDWRRYQGKQASPLATRPAPRLYEGKARKSL